MSFWIYRKNKEGKKEMYSVTIPIEMLMIIMGLITALIVPRYLISPIRVITDSMFIVIFGFILFAIAKISLFSKGIWNSWGSKLMDKRYRILYRTGYIIMGIGVAVLLVL
jgi:hypothetical protein